MTCVVLVLFGLTYLEGAGAGPRTADRPSGHRADRRRRAGSSRRGSARGNGRGHSLPTLLLLGGLMILRQRAGASVLLRRGRDVDFRARPARVFLLASTIAIGGILSAFRRQ